PRPSSAAAATHTSAAKPFCLPLRRAAPTPPGSPAPTAPPGPPASRPAPHGHAARTPPRSLIAPPLAVSHLPTAPAPDAGSARRRVRDRSPRAPAPLLQIVPASGGCPPNNPPIAPVPPDVGPLPSMPSVSSPRLALNPTA